MATKGSKIEKCSKTSMHSGNEDRLEGSIVGVG